MYSPLLPSSDTSNLSQDGRKLALWSHQSSLIRVFVLDDQRLTTVADIRTERSNHSSTVQWLHDGSILLTGTTAIYLSIKKEPDGYISVLLPQHLGLRKPSSHPHFQAVLTISIANDIVELVSIRPWRPTRFILLIHLGRCAIEVCLGCCLPGCVRQMISFFTSSKVRAYDYDLDNLLTLSPPKARGIFRNILRALVIEPYRDVYSWRYQLLFGLLVYVIQSVASRGK